MGVTDIERRVLKSGAMMPDISDLPVRVPRDKAAELISQYFFQSVHGRWNAGRCDGAG